MSFKLVDLTCINCGMKNITCNFDQVIFTPQGEMLGVIITPLADHPNGEVIECIKIRMPDEGKKDFFVEFDCSKRIKVSEQIHPCNKVKAEVMK